MGRMRVRGGASGTICGKSTVTVRGQTVIPTAIRKKLNINEGTKLEWYVDGNILRVRPLPADPIAALEGILESSGITEFLLQGRKEERTREAKHNATA